ncbi:hypothetical protein AB0K35_27925 [Micromonospora sp. NPDC053740]|uniref:hypothetical protein n=1 Tax=Micromonospora sp. NPDC053740 TaxID=3155173 RepID=UPI00343D65AF
MLPTFGVAAGWTPSLTGRHPTHLGGDVDQWRLHNGRAVRGDTTPADSADDHGLSVLDGRHDFAVGVSRVNRIRPNQPRQSRWARR